mgnify:CR=1 FL=1
MKIQLKLIFFPILIIFILNLQLNPISEHAQLFGSIFNDHHSEIE